MPPPASPGQHVDGGVGWVTYIAVREGTDCNEACTPTEKLPLHRRARCQEQMTRGWTSGTTSAWQGRSSAFVTELPARLLTAVVNAADAVPESRRCFSCLVAEELAECGRVGHA